jgi:hypothetical protein
MKKRILFVGDQKEVLEGLRVMLQNTPHEWERAFVQGCHEWETATRSHLQQGCL